MAYSELLADRIRNYFESQRIVFETKKMMGGLCFMVNDKMCVGVHTDSLMARVGKEVYDAALMREGCKPMDITGRPLKGFVFVEPSGIDMDTDLEYWLDLCLAFNPHAKSSKRKKKK